MRLLRLFLPLKSSKKLLLFLFISAFSYVWLLNHLLVYVDIVYEILSFDDFEENLRFNNTKYILVWQGYYLIFPKKGKQPSIFPSLNCKVKNCFFTENENYLDGLNREFDAVMFDENKLISPKKPAKRTSSQLYVFTTIESSYNKPACELYNDNFFNWTFTYRLDSTVRWNYFVVKNLGGDIEAPDPNVKWQTGSLPITKDIKRLLAKKTRAAAWLVSNCDSDSFRNLYLQNLREHLASFHLTIDVYGKCTGRRCFKDDCDTMVKKHYFFYMAFENSFSEDYVTEKVLHGYDNYAVPVVYGDANYTRFLPTGSYINARHLHPYNLANMMHKAVVDHSYYEKFFEWTNYYTIESKPFQYHPLCDFCAALNEDIKPVTTPNFRVWWNGKNGMKWCLSPEYWRETNWVNLDGTHLFPMY